VRRRPSGRLDLLPSNRDLAGAEVELVDEPEREIRLRQALESVADEYDYIFVDRPPALNLLTVNGLAAAQAVIIPMQCEYYALEGLMTCRRSRVRATSTPRSKSRFAAHHVRSAQHLALQASARWSSISAARFIAPSSRATFGWRRRCYGLPVIEHDRHSKGACLSGAGIRDHAQTAGESQAGTGG
jgi:chromosome partitioning protein